MHGHNIRCLKQGIKIHALVAILRMVSGSGIIDHMAGLDVLGAEPMREDNPLRRIKDSEKLVITPHIAWAAVETRKRLMDIILHQVKELFEVKQK